MHSHSRFAAVLLVASLITRPVPAQPIQNWAPGFATFGSFTVSGPTFDTGTNNYSWVINDAGPSITYPNAPGMAGPPPVGNLQVTGWDLAKAIQVSPHNLIPATPGDFYWDATPTDRFRMNLGTLVGPYSSAANNAWNVMGPMADFDPYQTYKWAIVTYQGSYKTHNPAAYPFGPPTDSATLNASTIFDLEGDYAPPFANLHPGTFSWQVDPVAKELDLTYTPPQPSVPEPGTFALVAVGMVAAWRVRCRRRSF